MITKKLLDKILLCARLALVLVVFLAICGMLHIELNTSIFNMLPKDPDLESLEEYNRIFSLLDRISITVIHPGGKEKLTAAAEYTAEKLRAHRLFAGSKAKFDPIEFGEIRSFYEQQLPNMLTAEDLRRLDEKLKPDYIERRLEAIFEEQVAMGPSAENFRSDPLQFSVVFWQKLRLQASFGGISDGYLMSREQNAVLLRIPPFTNELSTQDAEECWRFLEEVERQLQQQFPAAKMVSIGGKKAFLDNTKAIWEDVTLASTITTIAVSLLMLLILRNFFTFPIIFLPLFFGMFNAIGVSLLLAPQLSLMTLGFGAVLIGINIDYVIHYLTHFEASDEISSSGVLQQLLRPMSFAAFSTSGALAALLLSDFPIHIEVGWFVGTGILSSFLFMVGAFPLLCDKLYNRKETLRQPWVNLPKILDKVAHSRRSSLFSLAIAVFSLIITIFSYYNIDRLQFVGDVKQFNYQSEQTEAAEQQFFAIWGDQRDRAAVVVYGDSLEEALRHNDELAVPLLAKERAGSVQLLTRYFTLLPSLETMAENRKAWQEYWTPQRQQQLRANFAKACARYGFSQKAFQPFFSQLENPPTPESPSRWLDHSAFAEFISGQIKQQDGRWYIQSIYRYQSGYDPAVGAELKVRPNTLVIDYQGVMDKITPMVVDSTKQNIMLVGVYTVVLLVLYFVHLELIFIVSFPLILSLFWILGMMAWLEAPLNLFNSLMIVFALGLGIDYTCFHTESYLFAIGREQRTITATRSAIVLSALTTLSCFGVLALTQHPALYSLGICVVVAITAVLFNSLFLTPLLLHYFIPPERKSHPIRFFHVITSLWSQVCFSGGIVVLSALVFPLVALYEIFLRKDKTTWPYLRLIEFSNWLLTAKTPFNRLRLLDFPPREQVQGCVVVINHVNAADIPAFNALPFDKVTVVKWFWKVPFMGRLLKMAGYLKMPSQQNIPFEEWLAECQAVLAKKVNVLFFPEGTRVQSFQMGRFRSGAFQLACTAKVPILPVCLFNTRWIVPRGRFLMRDCEMIVKALPLLTPDNADYGDPRALAEQTKNAIQEAYEKLAKEKACENRQQRLVCDAYRYMNPYFDLRLSLKLLFDKNYAQLPTLLPRQGNILDIGCGAGFLSNLMVYSAEQRQVTAIDADSNNIDIARSSLISYVADSLAFIHGEFLQEIGKAIPTQHFAGALCILDNFAADEQRRVLAAAWQALAANATFVVRYKTSSPETLRQWLEESGFVDIQISSLSTAKNAVLVARKT